MNLLNLIENTTGGYDNLRALLQAVSTRSPANLNIGGDPITLDYMEANFLNGIYRAYLKAGRQEEFIQDLGDARRFDMHMKKLRDLIAKQKSFRGSVPGERGVTGDVPAGVMEGLESLEEIAMQDPNNPTDQNAGKLNWTRMIQDYMGNKPYTEFEFGTDRPLTLYRTQVYAILKAFGNMKPQQKLNIILNTFGDKVATVQYLDKLRAKGMIQKKVPAYVAPDTEAPAPGQMSLPGLDMPRIKEAQKKNPQELDRDTAVSAKVQRAFQLARARQPAAASDIEAFVKDELERGEELAQQVGQLQQDNEQQSQQIAQLTKAVSQQDKAEPRPPAPSAPAARAPTAPATPQKQPTAKAEPEAKPKDKEEPKVEPRAEPAPQTQPAPAKARRPRAKPRAKPQKAPVELPPVDTTIQLPPQQIPDQRPSAKILKFPAGKPNELDAAMQGLDLGDVPRAVGQNESVRVTVRGNTLFEGKNGTVKQRIADDFFMVDIDKFGSHAFHVSKLVFEMQTKLDRFNIDRPMLPSGVAKVRYAQDNNMYDDARIQEALPDKAMAVLKNLQQQQQQPEPVIDLNVPAGPRRGRPTNAQRAQRHEEFLTLRRRIALLDELIQMKEQIDRLFLKAQNVRGGIYPGLQADIEMEELYGVPQTDREYQDLYNKYTKDLAALQKFLAMKKAVYREDDDSMLGESTALVRLKQARQQLAQQGVAEGFLGDREYNRVMPFVKRIAGEVSDYDRDEFGEELWSLLDQKYGSKFAQSVLQDNLVFYWDEYADLTGQGVAEGLNESQFKSKEEAVKYAKDRVKTFRDKLDGIEVWAMPDGGFDVNHTMNSSGRNHSIDNGGKKLGTIYAGSLSEAPGVAEAQTDYQKRRQRERDVDAGRPVKALPKNPQTDYAKKRAKDRRDMELGEQQMCPECGGPSFSDMILAEKQDACYHKVRSRYKVWPSAYASGALVQCRKKGAANWGTGGKKK